MAAHNALSAFRDCDRDCGHDCDRDCYHDCYHDCDCVCVMTHELAGGGVYFEFDGPIISSVSVHISNSTITHNVASAEGGGLYAEYYASIVHGALMVIEDCLISGNSADGMQRCITCSPMCWCCEMPP